MGFLIPTLICWVVWGVTMFGGFPWPVFPMIGTAIPLLGTVVQRKDIIESNKRRIVRKQERELRRQQRKQLPPVGTGLAATRPRPRRVVEQPLLAGRRRRSAGRW